MKVATTPCASVMIVTKILHTLTLFGPWRAAGSSTVPVVIIPGQSTPQCIAERASIKEES